MSKTYIQFLSSRCSGCGACAIACMDQNDIDLEAGQQPFRTICETEIPDGHILWESRSCYHCSEPACMDACPVDVFYPDPDTGMILYDNRECISCEACKDACQHACITFNEDGRMTKCDGCAERIRAGMEPACVRTCPTGALRLITNL